MDNNKYLKNTTKLLSFNRKLSFIAFSFDIVHDDVGATLADTRIVTGRSKPYPPTIEESMSKKNVIIETGFSNMKILLKWLSLHRDPPFQGGIDFIYRFSIKR